MKRIAKCFLALLLVFSLLVCMGAPAAAVDNSSVLVSAQEESKSVNIGDKILDFLWSIVVAIQDLWYSDWNLIYQTYKNTKAATPAANTVVALPEYEGVKSADFYVSPGGSDENDGSLERPFATIEKARDAVRALDKAGKSEVIVGIMPGDYRTTGITFTAEDSGTKDCPIRYCKYGEGEVIINGGVSLNSEDFTPVSDETMLSRLSDDAEKNVVCVDLSKYGITAEDYGKIYAIGSYTTAGKYDGDWTGAIYSEVFFNDVRMDMARYPDKSADYLYTEEVVFTGENTVTSDWENIRNPKSDIYTVSQELADRINSWKTFDDVWIFAWWMYDWADSSSPIGEFNYAELTFSPKFVSAYGTREKAPYYFYNVFEELTTPGEFYLDRENAVLYIYPTDDMANASIDMSLTTNNLITLTNANYIFFEGITFKGTRGNAISVNGNGNQLTHCLIKNVAGCAISSYGYYNLYDCNEITRTGQSGIVLNGGDRTTLTAGNNKAENNLIHDWSEIYQTYQPAVYLEGVGNICAHNEIYNSPHEAISWGGNNHIIEYNIVHDVCLLTNDGGALYCGRRWDCYGNVIRYNYIYDLGSTVKNGDEEIAYTPDGIYFDDNMAGQTAYGNILVNVPKNGFLVGSGRDNTVTNNIVINSKNCITFDNRAREGFDGGWFTHHFEDKENGLLADLLASPWQTEIWQEAFPQYKNMTVDYSDIDNPNLPFNPTDSVISTNIFVYGERRGMGDISEDLYDFGTVENNLLISKLEMGRYFTNPRKGDYSIKDIDALQKKIPGFEEIPTDEIGIVF